MLITVIRFRICTSNVTDKNRRVWIGLLKFEQVMLLIRIGGVDWSIKICTSNATDKNRGCGLVY